MLGPSLLEMLHDVVFMELPKLGSFSVIGCFLVNVMTVFCVPNETVLSISGSCGSALKANAPCN